MLFYIFISISIFLVITLIIFHIFTEKYVRSRPNSKKYLPSKYISNLTPSHPLLKNKNLSNTLAFNLISELISKSIQTNQIFHHGTFILNTGPFDFYNFLISSNSVYHRESSHHFPGNKPQFGIDLLEDIKISHHNISVTHRHLLLVTYKIADENFLVIKPEPHGVQKYSQSLLHCMDYILSRKYFILLRDCRKKKIYRKERTSDSQILLYNKYLKSNNNNYYSKRKKFVFEMINDLKQIKSDISKQFIIDISNQLQINPKSENYFSYRLGNEVYFNFQTTQNIISKVFI